MVVEHLVAAGRAPFSTSGRPPTLQLLVVHRNKGTPYKNHAPAALPAQ